MLLIKKVVDYFIWVMFFVFLLFGVFVYVFSNTNPGDYLYPFKQNIEKFFISFK